MKPIYAENIIVAIKSCGCIEWYILDKDYCFLDYPKLEEAYRKKGYNDTFDDDSRFGIKVVNELSKTQFLDNIKEYKSIYENNFTINEIMHINQSLNPFKEFIKIWTFKEAYVKMIGTGLSTPLSSFDVIKKSSDFKILTTEYKRAVISVCCDCSCSNITIIPVTLEEIVRFYN